MYRDISFVGYGFTETASQLTVVCSLPNNFARCLELEKKMQISSPRLVGTDKHSQA